MGSSPTAPTIYGRVAQLAEQSRIMPSEQSVKSHCKISTLDKFAGWCIIIAMNIEHCLTNNVAKVIVAQLGNKAVYHFQPDDSPDQQEAANQLMQEDGYSCLKVIKESDHSYWVINVDSKQVVEK